MHKIIEIEKLRKSYGNITAVNEISFYVERGQFFALLGQNGAGKTTTMDILCTLMTHDSGIVTIDGLRLGKDDQKIKSKIGVVFQDSVLDPLLTVRENLTIRAKFYFKNKADAKQAVHDTVLAVESMEFIDQPYGKLSGGQRRRVDIARALLHRPDILFLDEPTTGLDPHARKLVWTTIKRLQQEREMTVLLTTHYMEEAAISDYIVMLNHGRIIADGTASELKAKYKANTLDEVFINLFEQEATQNE